MSVYKDIRPQPKQEQFLSSPADVVFYGGAAGSGKTISVLLEPLRHVKNKDFKPVILRRTKSDIKKQGGIWDESEKIYPGLGGVGTPSSLTWKFPGGMTLKFDGIEYDKDLQSWQSAQLALIIFEELCQFTEKMFWYMMSRNRSTCGVRPYVRATMNPDPDSFVRRFIDWYVDKDGFIDPEKSGVIRYFSKDGDEVIWGDTREEVLEKVNDPELELDEVKSFTFIAASVYDNQELLKVDKGYLGNLKSLSRVERAQLLGDKIKGGNWNVRPAAGEYFKRKWTEGKMIDMKDLPEDIRLGRGWDFAGTTVEENPNADQTAKFKLGVTGKGADRIYYVVHADKFRKSPHHVEADLLKTAQDDGKHVKIRIPQDPAQAGKSQARRMIALLSGFKASAKPPTGKKTTRFSPFSAQMEAGNVYWVIGHWNEMVWKEFEAFSGVEGGIDDLVDAASDAFDLLSIDRDFRAY